MLAYNLFAYCSNNPETFSDSAGTSKEPIWKTMGFVYDGSMRDFRRLNQGLPPYAYEQWLATGGTIETNYTTNSSNGVNVIMESVTYVPDNQAKDFYITELEAGQGGSVFEDVCFGLGTATLFIKNCPSIISIGLYAIDAIVWFNDKAAQANLMAYEKAMNKGKGVLIVVWAVEGNRCVNNRHTTYYSWNGEGDPFEK